MFEPRYEIVDHTADVAVRAYGRSLGELFAESARGMYAIMADPVTIAPRTTRELKVDAPDRERLLVEWLLELLFLTESEGLLFSEFEVRLDSECCALTATARGERIDHDRHHLGPEVKAVTRHQLEVTEVEGGYAASIVFDI